MIITPAGYAKLIGYEGDNPTLDDIQEYAQDHLDETLWDYPLAEADDIKSDVVMVEENGEIRLCEKL